MPIQIRGKQPNPKHRGSTKPTGAKDPAAVSLGRKGGKVGGRADPRPRKEINPGISLYKSFSERV